MTLVIYEKLNGNSLASGTWDSSCLKLAFQLNFLNTTDRLSALIELVLSLSFCYSFCICFCKKKYLQQLVQFTLKTVLSTNYLNSSLHNKELLTYSSFIIINKKEGSLLKKGTAQ